MHNFCQKEKSVLVTALTNEALKVIASKEDLKPYLEGGKVSKTSLTIDERHELPKLVANEGNVCNASPGYLTLASVLHFKWVGKRTCMKRLLLIRRS